MAGAAPDEDGNVRGTSLAAPPRMAIENVIHPVRADDLQRVVEVWEASVRASHGFVSEAYIQVLKPIVRDELLPLFELASVRNDCGEIVGFIGVADGKIEALFVHPSWRRAGIGRQLVNFAVAARAARSIDLNPRNEIAVRFFQQLGFQIVARSDENGMGQAFPILHMQRPP